MRLLLLAILVPSLALASKPRVERNEQLKPPAPETGGEAEQSEAPKKPRNLTLTGDIGLGG